MKARLRSGCDRSLIGIDDFADDGDVVGVKDGGVGRGVGCRCGSDQVESFDQFGMEREYGH